MRVPAEVVWKLDLSGDRPSGCSAGPADTLHLLLASRQKRFRWRVHCFGGRWDWQYEIEQDLSGFQFVQPLPEGLLFARARQPAGAPNGRVYHFDGRLLRELALGDGIANLQATVAGAIWASYFDEGVFGHTVGAAGLVRFGADGTPCYTSQPCAGLDRISDCYALNVDGSNAVWFYYYTPFPLIRLRNDAIDGVWQPNIAGATAFAVLGDQITMHAGYSQERWQLLQLHEHGSVTNLGYVEFVDESGNPLPARCALARGRLIWFIQNSTVYRVDTSQLV